MPSAAMLCAAVAAVATCGVTGAAADALPVNHRHRAALRALEAAELRHHHREAAAVGGSNGTTVNVTQVHLALSHTSESMAVSWTCDAPTAVAVATSPAGLAGSPRVVTPLEAAPYSTVSIPRGESTFASYTSGVINHAVVPALLPRTKYFYQIVPAAGPGGGGNASSAVARPSEVFSFTTPPALGDQSPMVFDVVGDLGQTNDSVLTLEHIVGDAGNGSEFVLHTGDMSYADCLGPRWDSYFDLIEPLASRLPWMVSAGNHEVEPNNMTGRIMDSYKARYLMPQAAPTVDTTQYYQQPNQTGYDCTPSAFTGEYDFGNSFYSFRTGMVHFIILNSYTRTDNASNQYTWLQQELETKVDRTITPWVIAMWHSPWYNSNKAHQNEFNTVAMRASMEQLLVSQGVAMVFNGHVHAYERSHPAAFNQTVADGKAPVYMVIGDGGNREGHADAYAGTAPVWSAYRNASDFGHGRVRVQNASHAVWEWHINNADDWVVSDQAVIVNPFTADPPLPPSTCNATTITANHSGPPAPCVYFNNHTGHHTIGYGFDLETAVAHQIIPAALGLNYNDVFFGHVCLNQTAMDYLLQFNLQIAAFQAVTALGKTYPTVCCPVANALVDMAYNISTFATAPLHTFHGLIQALLAHDYHNASAEVMKSDWCSKSPTACAADAAALGRGCPPPNATAAASTGAMHVASA